MDERRFDRIARRLGHGIPRRPLIAAAAATVLAALQRPQSALACKKVGKKCDKNNDCCDGARCKGDTKKKKGSAGARVVGRIATATRNASGSTPTSTAAVAATRAPPCRVVAKGLPASSCWITTSIAAPAATPVRKARFATPPLAFRSELGKRG
jgi:hypothetical protein